MRKRNGRVLRERSNITRSVGRLLAYCATIRGCRQYLLRGGALALVLIVPDDADIEDYRHATDFAFSKPNRFDGFDFGDNAKIVVAADHWRKERKEPAPDDLLKHDCLVILASDVAEIPNAVMAAIDGVVRLDRPQIRHLIGAGRVCLKQRMSVEQAEELGAMPLALISSMLWRGRPVSQSLDHMREALKDRTPAKKRELRIENLHGLGEAGTWARDLAQDLNDWREGRIGWEDIDRGILISGPTGTGKTTFGKALAASCGVHLVLASLARWQAHGHLGDLLRAMRAAFDEARKNAPSIIFIDEIDAAGDREKFSDDYNSQYHNQVVSGLLECIDGAERREGVIIVGACNFPERLDAALVRPGRLDRHVKIPLPDGVAREGIIRWHLAGAFDDDDLSVITKRTEGWSGAALEQLARDARRSARRAQRNVSVSDLEAALPPTVSFPAAMLRRAAVHEAGHVIAAVALERSFEFAEIRDKVDLASGYQSLGRVRVGKTPVTEITAQSLLDEICFLLAGIAAEEAILGSRSVGGGGVPGSDLHLATLVALRLEASYGLGEGLAFLAGDSEPELLRLLHTSQAIRERVEIVLAEQMARVRSLVERQRGAVERAADELLEGRRITGVSAGELMASVVTRPGIGRELVAIGSAQ
ncbi:AAA family ATPase [Bosea sp. (in: a-proteobacteria)]|uniref:AAA family ATPase n=1 Tax=Bosea sp. (in: a-proteobacteria) TaxID=1871050 RepID=UPI001AC62522|nr:AAA family ATPase [Bosea sp. (in: a-proteobacteria)]MBN9436966.1 AAA family ATPase [Bosea sp. (in: a-proteobacteria)]